MLSAILNGKSRRLPEGLPEGASVRMVFRRSEDILTSTVFERLAYLQGPVLWQVLAAAFQPQVLPRRSLVKLHEIEFWPTWGQCRETLGKAVEPDVVMRLTVGDPPVSVILIIECKLDGFQDPRQWAEEWIGYRAQAEPSEIPLEICLLALGGLRKGAAATVAEFAAIIRPDHGVEIRAAAAGWQDLRKALDDVKDISIIDGRIISDIQAALELYGFRPFRPMQDIIIAASSLGGISADPIALRWEKGSLKRPDRFEYTFSDFASKTSALRPLKEHSNLRWSNNDA